MFSMPPFLEAVGLVPRSVEANLKAKNADRAALRNAGFSVEKATISTCSFSHRHTTVREQLLLMPAISFAVTGNEIYPYLSRVRFQKFDEILQRGTRPESALQAAPSMTSP